MGKQGAEGQPCDGLPGDHVIVDGHEEAASEAGSGTYIPGHI
jgi:hypothetical protein